MNRPMHCHRTKGTMQVVDFMNTMNQMDWTWRFCIHAFAKICDQWDVCFFKSLITFCWMKSL